MHALNNRAGRFTARLALESLESRTLLSATMPTAAPVAPATTSHAAASDIQVHHLTSNTTHAATVNFQYDWSVGPSAVMIGTNSTTGNGKSTGSVDFALVRPGSDSTKLGGMPTAVPLGFLVTTGSASDAHPDHFNIKISLKLSLRDSATGKSGELTFNGMLTGTLTANQSSLTITLQTPSQQLILGNKVYSVTLAKTMHPAGPNDVPSAVYAFVHVTPLHVKGH